MKKNRMSMRVAAIVVVLTVLTASLAFPVHASDMLLTLKGDTVTAELGDIVSLTVSLTANPGFVAMNVYYTYDTDQLTLVSAQNQASGLTFTHDKTSVWDGLNNYTQTGALVILNFRVSDTAEAGSYEVKIHFIEAFNEDLDDVYANTVSGYVQVGCSHKHRETVAAVPATCISEGYTAGVRCTDCGVIISGHQKLDKLNTHTWSAWGKFSDTLHEHACELCGKTEKAVHSWNQGVVTKPATHTGEGIKTYTCTACHATKIEVIDRVQDHSFGMWMKESSTHHKRVCACGHTEYGAHNWDDGVVREEATHQHSGSRVYTCRDCGETRMEDIPQIEHSFDQKRTSAGYLVKEATCTEAAVYYFSCSCGAKGTATFTFGEAKGHSFTRYVYNQDATCVKDGTETAVCSSCDETHTRTKQSSVLGHDWSDQWFSNSQGHFHMCERCQEVTTVTPHVSDGNATEYTDEICTVCRYVITPALGHIHKMMTISATAPTCTRDGNIDYYYCSGCEKRFRDVTAKQEITDVSETVIPATGHTEVADAAVTATCTESGLTAGSHCRVCSFVIVQQTVIPAKGHRETYDAGYRATCTTSGLTEGSHCTVCQTVLIAQEIIPAKGHTPGASATCMSKQICTVCGEVLHGSLGHAYEDRVVAPTCTESGYTVHTCTRCGDQFKDSYQNAVGHKAVGEASCTSDQICSVCGSIMTQKYGHTYRDETRLPTCTEAGYTLHTCERCGINYKDAYTDATGHKAVQAADCETDSVCANCNQILAAKLGHFYQSVVTAATCTEKGYTTHTCSRCSDTYVDSEVAARGHTSGAEADCCNDQTCSVCGAVLAEKLGHDYNAVVTAPTCTEKGYTIHTCSRCDDTYTDSEVAALGHIAGTEADCLNDQLCTVCGAVLVEKLGHDYNAVVTAPTCTEQGYTTHACNRCDDTYTDSKVEALDHTAGDWIIDVEPAPGVEGSQHKECTVCYETLETAVIEALPVETEPQTETSLETETPAESETPARAEAPTEPVSKQEEPADPNGCLGLVSVDVVCLIILMSVASLIFVKRREENC
ncbi:MAG: hypothetical protein IJW90_08770 [Clostridia bacterium]|nr:hypothetical protein [Clostridia bacterium]